MTFAAIDWSSWVTTAHLETGLRVLLLLVVGLPAARLVAHVAGRMTARRFSEQSAMVVRKIFFYSIVSILLVMVLNELGFQLATLLGAAGIAGIALGFASQTSVSNIISGIFLISERAFEVGDLIQVGSTVGLVESVDLLSAKVRTFDNRYVRIPNETLIKSEVINYTHFPLRRIDLQLGVAYRESDSRVEGVLREIAAANPLCLDEPEPLFIFKEFGDSALLFQFSVWCVKTDYLELKNSMMRTIKERFDAEDIEIPFPHVTLYAGSRTTPMPVHMVPDPGGSDGSVDQER